MEPIRKQGRVIYFMFRFAGKVFLVVLVVIVIIFCLGWWAGWQTLEEFQKAIQIAGILVIGLGLLGVKTGRDFAHASTHLDSRPNSRKTSWERIQQALLDFIQSYVFMLVSFAAGAICLVIGWLL